MIARSANGSLIVYSKFKYRKDFTRQRVEIWNACGPVEHCVERVRGFIVAGFEHITIRPIGNNLSERLHIYLEELIPIYLLILLVIRSVPTRKLGTTRVLKVEN